jgi:cupin fold WbuC family metalloprotein
MRFAVASAYNIRMNSEVQFIDFDMLGPLKEKALASRRLRTNHNFHSGNEDNPHRFLNVMARGTYVPPHRHLDPLKSETFLILEGKVGLFLFDDSGKVTLAEVVGGSQRLGADIPAGAWHTLAVLTPFVVSFEVKPGPYVARSDKDIPAWAPQEGEPGARAYLDWLLEQLPAAR